MDTQFFFVITTVWNTYAYSGAMGLGGIGGSFGFTIAVTSTRNLYQRPLEKRQTLHVGHQIGIVQERLLDKHHQGMLN